MINKSRDNISIFVALLFIILFFSFFLSSNNIQTDLINNVEKNNISTDLIVDEINPYCKGINYLDNTTEFSNIKNLEIEMDNQRDWYQNLSELFLSNGVIIESSYKKRFNAEVTVLFDNNLSCRFNSKIRISGDFKDHIKFSAKPITSLDVDLQNGNILGITKFKLFLDTSKGTNGGEIEVLLSIILREAGFISPRTSIIPVKVNSSEFSNYIFQEKPSKEMIEFHEYREGPIIETDETFVFEFDKYASSPFDEDREYLFFGKILNENWIERDIANMHIGATALQLYNLAIYSSFNPNSQMNYNILNPNPLNLYIFDALNFSLNSTHGITNHNRKFFYDKISETFIPIYFDGDSHFLDDPNLSIRPDYKNYNEISQAAQYILNNFYFDKENLTKEFNAYGLNYDLEKTKLIIRNLVTNLEEASKLSFNNEFTQTLEQNILKTEFHNVEFLFLENEQYQICDQYFLDCSDSVNFRNINQIIDLLKDTNIVLFGKSKTEFLSMMNTPKKISFNKSYKLQENISIVTYYSPQILIDEQLKEVNIFIDESKQKVVVEGDGVLSDWVFNINSSVTDELETRQDEHLLTGCLTFSNLIIEKIVINANNQHCEDAVNLLRVNGDIESISINNSLSDGLDIDFSSLEIKNITVTNSGNDCVDLSGGQYKIYSIELVSCKDKGVSIGEKSTVKINNLNVNNSYITTAVKDSSDVEINQLVSSNNTICIAIYRKKQEFGPSKLTVMSKICDAKVEDFIQLGSYFEN